MTAIGVIAAVIIGAMLGVAILVFAIEGALTESDVAEAKAFIGWYVTRNLRWKEAIKTYEREYGVKLKKAAIDIAFKELGL